MPQEFDNLSAELDSLREQITNLNNHIEKIQRENESLISTERKFRDLIELLPETAFQMNTDLILTYVNKAGLELMGYTQNDINNGLNALETIIPEDREKAIENTARVLNGGKAELKKYTALRKDGTTFPAIIKAIPIIENNIITGMRGILVDISSREDFDRIQAALVKISESRNLHGKFDEMLAEIHKILGSLIDTTDFYIALYNKADDTYDFPYYVSTKYKSAWTSRSIKKHLTDYVRKTGKPLLANHAVYEELSAKGEFDIDKDLPSSWLGVPLKIAGITIGVVAVRSYEPSLQYNENDLKILDMVSGNIAMSIKQKRAEDALRESEEKYRSFIEKASEPIFSITETGEFLVVNVAAAKYLGGIPKDFINRSMWDLFPKKIADKQMKSVLKSINTQKALTIEARTILNGQERWFSNKIDPVQDSKGSVRSVQIIASDITDRKRNEIREKARLKLLNLLRDAKNVDECLEYGCNAIYESELFKRAVLTLHSDKREITNIGYIGLEKSVIAAALKAPAPDPRMSAQITQEKFRISHSYFIPKEAYTGIQNLSQYISQRKEKDEEKTSWKAGDDLFVPVFGDNSKHCGWLSVDTPFNKCRPTTDEVIILEEIVDIVTKKVREIQSLDELSKERKTLHEKNIALKEILDSIENEKDEIRRQISSTIDQTILPALSKLIKRDGTVNKAYYNVIAHDLQRLAAITGKDDILESLSPREFEICTLIKNGASSKDIAEALNISVSTVQKHREVIRKKLGLINQNINLTTYLLKK